MRGVREGRGNNFDNWVVEGLELVAGVNPKFGNCNMREIISTCQVASRKMIVIGVDMFGDFYGIV